ncbi:MAG: efflux RND transporter permease subunit [Thermodesulfobacteriota bacterium]|nr:efflux RND transporter permease subunit [Thermodesulfobacteriota bacterium]
MNALLAWLLKRTVFANALMVVFLLGGLLSAMSIRQELLPDREERCVEVAVELPGASPDEVKTSILDVVENAVRGLDGIKRVNAEAREGIGMVTIALLESANTQQMLGDIKNAVDRITTFPQDAEEPMVSIPSEVEKALSIVVYGDQPLMWLRKTGESVRDDLRVRVGLKKVELAFPREQEISVEIPEATLRQYGLSLEDVAEKIRQNSLDLPGGTLFSTRADIALRTVERREWAKDFSDIVVAQTTKGIPLRLADIAVLKNGFGESPIESWFNGHPAIQIDVFAVGDETPISVEAAVQEYLGTFARERYQGVEIVVFENEAEAYRSRMALLIDNALIGLILVLVTLGLFLTPHLAFWVMVGIPTSLLGGMLLLPLFDASLNMISLFAFIITIGVVVDDTIMMGEAIHVHRGKGRDHLSSALQGLKEMGGPVLLATSTTIIAFLPSFFVPGSMGEIFRQIPAVVVAVLLVSLIESLFILAAHLAQDRPERPWLTWLARPQQAVNAKLQLFIEGTFRRFMQKGLQRPSLMIASALSLLLVTFGGVTGGLLGFSFTPTIESDTVIAQATLPYGTPRRQSVALQQELVETANGVLKDHSMASPGIFSLIGTRLEEGEVELETLAGSHYVSVLMAMPPEGERTLSGREFARAWQNAFGERNELEALNFTGETNVTSGEPVRLEVFHPDQTVARSAALALGERLRAFAGLSSIDDGIRAGKPELKLTLREQGLLMGLTAEDMATQVRHRYYGAEALRFVRDGNEIKVMVRLNEKERRQHGALQEVLLKTPSNTLVPLTEVADITQTHSFTTVAQRDGKRIYPVTADIGVGISDDVVEDALEEGILPALMAEFPGLSVGFGGEEEEIDESLGALGNGFLVVLGAIYLLLSLYYNSYIQPLLVLSVIPFSLIGAVWGHILLGYDLSIVSMVGVVAMAGVVVNDSLVLVTTYNWHRAHGKDQQGAIVNAACHRFRPILLTSLTTFLGLMPLLLETSEQAQFLIPATISISFGLAFGTVITLVLLPAILGLIAKKGE